MYQLGSEDVGIESQTLKGLVIDSSAESLALIQSAFNPDISESSPDLLPKKFQSIQKAHAMIALNAGAAIYVSGRADSLGAGVSMAETVIQNGLTLKKLHDLAKFTQRFWL